MSQQRILLLTLIATLVAAAAGFFYIRRVYHSPPAPVLPDQGWHLHTNGPTAFQIGTGEVRKAGRTGIGMEMRSRLSVGDTREMIERVLKEKKMRFNFDSVQQCYEADVDLPERRNDAPRVTVAIYVDGSNRLTKIEERVVAPATK